MPATRTTTLTTTVWVRRRSTASLTDLIVSFSTYGDPFRLILSYAYWGTTTVDTELYKLYLRHLYTSTTRLILSCVSFDNKIDLDELDNDRAVTPAIRMRFERDLNANRLTNCADTPTIYRLTDRPSSTFDHYYHPTLAPYCYYDRPPLLCLQPINPRCFIRSRLPLLLCPQLIDHLLPCLQPTDFYCPACSNNRIQGGALPLVRPCRLHHTATRPLLRCTSRS